MSSDVRTYLDTVLSRIEEESFGQRDAPRVSLSGDTRQDGDGGWSGVLEVRIHTRSGDMPIIQREPFAGVQSREEVDDLLARLLSVLLMNHAEWPR
ncbi:MAG: hypothetical protein M5U16_05315 [Hyphomicrobium sp.]|nr:hypothetical protein [Hyphomicrobium sp.]